MKLVRCKKPENCMVSDDPVITLEDRSIVTGYYHEEGDRYDRFESVKRTDGRVEWFHLVG
jgi:hypothetical protein